MLIEVMDRFFKLVVVHVMQIFEGRRIEPRDIVIALKLPIDIVCVKGTHARLSCIYVLVDVPPLLLIAPALAQYPDANQENQSTKHDDDNEVDFHGAVIASFA